MQKHPPENLMVLFGSSKHKFTPEAVAKGRSKKPMRAKKVGFV